jgi:hypothetical protein
LLDRDVAVAREASPIGLRELALERVAKRLVGRVGMGLAVAGAVEVSRQGLPGEHLGVERAAHGPLGRYREIAGLFHRIAPPHRSDERTTIDTYPTGVSVR